MNFVFISPNFPENYYRFCEELDRDGVTVLGIGDAPYDDLRWQLKRALTEYYRIDSLEDYDSVYRAVAFFAFKYGRIDWIESNNEYWLAQDAELRDDFNVSTGFHAEDMDRSRRKSVMKEYYRSIGIPVARYHLLSSPEADRAFIDEVGYPVVVKPDDGVGADDTHRIENDEQLAEFYAVPREGPYLMEEFVRGTVCSYDAIIDSGGNPLFETGNVSPVSIMDIVNESTDVFFYMVKNLPDDVRDAGRRTVKAFGVKSRFIHFEFFRLDEDQEGLGSKGDIVGLEVNMRPSGGLSPEMHNFANSTNVYKIYADMVAFNSTNVDTNGEQYYCAFVSRRLNRTFAMGHADVMATYGKDIVEHAPVPPALSGAMGDYVYIARFKEKASMLSFVKDVLA